MTRGTRMRKEMAWMDSSCGASSERLRHSGKLKVRKEPSCGVDDDLGLPLKKQREGAAGGADIDRLP